MFKKKSSMIVLVIFLAFMATALFFSGLIRAGDLNPPGSVGSTMKTLDEIPPTWSQILTASVRFEGVMGGSAVLDKETGLVWARYANIASGTKTWEDAMEYCRNLNIGGRIGWRLPTVEELSSLVDETESSPALPDGHPFIAVQSSYYWSSTTHASETYDAWAVSMSNGYVSHFNKTFDYCYVWPVRGGN
jgi:hypothetical protein